MVKTQAWARHPGAGERAQQVKALAGKSGSLCLLPETHRQMETTNQLSSDLTYTQWNTPPAHAYTR